MFVVTNRNFSHQRVVIAVICTSRRCLICNIITLFIFTIFLRSYNGLLRFSHLHDVIFLELLSLILIDRLSRLSSHIREHAPLLFALGTYLRLLWVNLSVSPRLNFALGCPSCRLLRRAFTLDTQGLVFEISGLLTIGSKDLANLLLLGVLL